MVDAGSIEQSIGFSTSKAAQQDGLSVLLGVARQVPLPHSHDVHTMLPLRHLVQRLKHYTAHSSCLSWQRLSALAALQSTGVWLWLKQYRHDPPTS